MSAIPADISSSTETQSRTSASPAAFWTRAIPASFNWAAYGCRCRTCILPFVQKLEWWQNGLAGAWPSLLCYIASVAGLYRLARRMMLPRWAIAATAFYALNPNLLYLATTAMTESLFLALVIWITLLTVECVAAIHAARYPAATSRLILIALFILAAVYTRYDGWILGAAAWCVLAITLARSKDAFRKVAPAFAVFTLLVVAGPLGWLAYNQHFFHDPLDFMRGPYSALAIERKTTPPGSGHYRGWHDPIWALILYTRTAQVDVAAWETGFLVMAASLAGLVLAIRRKIALPVLLLWFPLPFYIYSIAYGAVPIFIPQLWPHSYYNSRYGIEMLPAFAIFMFLTLDWAQRRWSASRPLAMRLFHPIVLLLIAVNAVVMVYRFPLVLKEAVVNSITRVAFETSLARELKRFPAGVRILMYNSDHVGALQAAGIPLRQTLNEGDYDSWKTALAAPAEHAQYVIAIAGDQVSTAVAEHPQNLTELSILCTSGQPCARIYQSGSFGSSPQPQSHNEQIRQNKSIMISFVKAHACGNDFLIIDEPLAQRRHADLARKLCARNTSVGADGIEFLDRKANGELFLRLFNADGSEAELSGNGTRCVAAWLASSEGLQHVALGTHGGLRTCHVVEANDPLYLIESEMGIPRVMQRTIELPGAGNIPGAMVNVGNPHFVLFVDTTTSARTVTPGSSLARRSAPARSFPMAPTLSSSASSRHPRSPSASTSAAAAPLPPRAPAPAPPLPQPWPCETRTANSPPSPKEARSAPSGRQTTP